MTQQCFQKKSTLRLLKKCLYNFGKDQSNLSSWAFRRSVLCQVLWPTKYRIDLPSPSLPPMLASFVRRKNMKTWSLSKHHHSILNTVKQEVLPSHSIPILFLPLRCRRVCPGKKPWDSISEFVISYDWHNGSCQHPRELTDKKNFMPILLVYEIPLCEAPSLDRCPETFVLLPLLTMLTTAKSTHKNCCKAIGSYLARFSTTRKMNKNLRKRICIVV